MSSCQVFLLIMYLQLIYIAKKKFINSDSFDGNFKFSFNIIMSTKKKPTTFVSRKIDLWQRI